MEHARTIFCLKLTINNHIVGLVHKNHIIRTRLMYHAACKVEFQPFKRLYSADVFQVIRARRVSNCYIQEKKTDRLCGCVCVDVRLILVLVLGRQIVYGQNTVYLCLSF